MSFIMDLPPDVATRQQAESSRQSDPNCYDLAALPEVAFFDE